MKFLIYIKSHSEIPDYEEQGDFVNRQSALQYWYLRLGKYGWSKEELDKYIEEVKE